MNILIAGGTGFIGKHLVRDLIGAGHKVILVHRPVSSKPIPAEENVRVLNLDPEQEIVAGDFAADAIINLVGIIREFPSRGITFHKAHFVVTKNLVDYAQRVGIPRFLQMSALGVRPGSWSKYIQSKYSGEKYVQESGLQYAIFRPSVVFGPHDHVVSLFDSLIRKLPAIGVVGDGEYKLQPVHVNDLTAGFVQALTDDRMLGSSFEIGGPEIMSFNRMLDYIGEAIGRAPVRKIHMPVGLLKGVSSVLKWYSKYPISPEQITLLIEGNYTEDKSYYNFVNRVAIPFKQGILEYLTPAK